MSVTLLIDLDDTLLENNIDRFLPVYLKALAKHLATRFPPDVMVRELLAATDLMIANLDPALTVEQVFDQAFYPALNSSKDEVRADLEKFYGETYPSFQPLTRARPEALRLVQQALDRGYQVVVATNPLFPRAAMLHRLEWAGMPVSQYSFTWIASYETSHFTKPRPEFYAELLAQIGWPEQPAVMIGNNLEEDIIPAAKLGLLTYWSAPDGQSNGILGPLSGQGPLSEAMDWIERTATKAGPPVANTPTALLAVLRATPAALQNITSRMDDRYWALQPKPGEWSISQILCHLRDGDREVQWPRIRQICQEDNPFLPGVDLDTWAEERRYDLQDGAAALQDFVAARRQILALLGSLPAEEWQRPARHAIFGPTHMAELVSFIATHDRNHLQQVVSNLGA